MFCTKMPCLGQQQSTKEIIQIITDKLINQPRPDVMALISSLKHDWLRSSFSRLTKKIKSLREGVRNIPLSQRSSIFSNLISEIQAEQSKNSFKEQNPLMSSILRKPHQEIEMQEKRMSQKRQRQVLNLENQLNKANNKIQRTQEEYRKNKQELLERISQLEQHITELQTYKQKTDRLFIFQPLERQLKINAQPEQELSSIFTISVKDSDPAEYIQYVVSIRRKEKKVSSALIPKPMQERVFQRWFSSR